MKTNKQINGTIRCAAVCTVHILHTHTSSTSFYVSFHFCFRLRVVCAGACFVRAAKKEEELGKNEKKKTKEERCCQQSHDFRIEKGQTISIPHNTIKCEILRFGIEEGGQNGKQENKNEKNEKRKLQAASATKIS